VNGVDDLGGVDALEVDGGDAEVSVAELPSTTTSSVLPGPTLLLRAKRKRVCGHA